MHGLQALRHQPERLAQPRLQRGLQFLVHGVAHLLELVGGVLLQVLQARLERAADGLQALFGGFVEAVEPTLGAVGELAQPGIEAGESRVRLAASGAVLLAHAALDAVEVGGELGDTRLQLRLPGRCRRAAPQRDQQQQLNDGQGRENPGG